MGGITVDQREGIFTLMVFGDIWRRNQDDRLSEQLQLADCAGAGTRYHKVGGTVSRGHVGDERRGLHILASLHGTAPGFFARAACLPQNLHRAVKQGIKPGSHGFVDGARAQTAAHHKHQRTLRVKTQGFFGLFLGQGHVEQRGADRVAGKYHAVFREKLSRFFVGGAYGVGILAEKLVGHSGIGVLLLNQSGNTRALGRLQSRA